MNIKDLELEAVKMDSFKAGYVTALETVARTLAKEEELAKKVAEAKNEPVSDNK